MLEPQEVVDALPELEVTMLNPIIVDGIEFLFLADIEKSMGLREDEALSILAIVALHLWQFMMQLQNTRASTTMPSDLISVCIWIPP